MDFIRSAYEVPARFFRDDPLILLPMHWSFVSKYTPGMPWAHAFGTRVWDTKDEDDPDVGEQNNPRTWFGGLPPFPLPLVGPLHLDDMGICGTEEQWQRGCLSTDPVPPDWPGTQVHRCCKPPPREAVGGVAIGSGKEYVCGPGSLFPNVFFMTLTALPGYCTFMNGEYPMVFTQVGGDHYEWIGIPPNSADGFVWTFLLTCDGPDVGGCGFLMSGQDTAGNSFALNFSAPFHIGYDGFGDTTFARTVGAFGCPAQPPFDPAGTASFRP